MNAKKFSKEELYKMDAIEIYKLVLEGKHLKRFPNGFWTKPDALDNAGKCLRYLIEDVLKLSDEELKKELSLSFLKENKLNGMLSCCFNNSPYNAINNAYPNKFKEWEFNSVCMNYWNDETAKDAIKWLIEDKLKLTEEELKETLSQDLFFKNGLSGLLMKKFNGSPVKAINHAYKNKYKPWEFKTVGHKYWNNETLIMAIKWLIEDKLKLSDNELKEQLSVKLFKDNGLISLLNYTNNSPYDAINLAYPNKFKKEEFKNYK